MNSYLVRVDISKSYHITIDAKNHTDAEKYAYSMIPEEVEEKGKIHSQNIEYAETKKEVF